MKRCEHGRRKERCKECGGSAFCEHGRIKATCKECGGSALCKTPHCVTRGNKKYNGHCLPCCIQLFPELKVSRNYKTKENDVVSKIVEYFPGMSWVSDKKVVDGCSSRRPDLLLDMGSHVIIVEIDENAHEGYDNTCENKRLVQISMDLQHRPTVFIRFNPDAYTDKDGRCVRSCWRLNKMGIMTVPKTKQVEWNERIKQLLSRIQYWIDHPPAKTIEIDWLFFNT